MEAIFFALVSFTGWAFGDLFVTVSARKLNAYSSTFWTFIISILLLSLYAPFVVKDLQNLTPNVFILNILLGFILLVGIITYREGLIIESSPLVVTISASFSAVTIILSLIFFQERLTIYQGLAIILVFIGIFLSMIDLRELRERKVSISKGLLFSLISMVLWGIYFAFIKIPVKQIGWFWPNYFSFLFFAPFVWWFIKVRKISFHMPNHNKAFLPLLAAVIFARGAELSFNAGIQNGYTSIVAPIAGANPVLFVILAFFFLKDPITKQQVFGIVTTLTGIILLSVLSV